MQITVHRSARLAPSTSVFQQGVESCRRQPPPLVTAPPSWVSRSYLRPYMTVNRASYKIRQFCDRHMCLSHGDVEVVVWIALQGRVVSASIKFGGTEFSVAQCTDILGIVLKKLNTVVVRLRCWHAHTNHIRRPIFLFVLQKRKLLRHNTKDRNT